MINQEANINEKVRGRVQNKNHKKALYRPLLNFSQFFLLFLVDSMKANSSCPLEKICN